MQNPLKYNTISRKNNIFFDLDHKIWIMMCEYL